MSIQIQLRRGNAATWTSVNPVLAEGEVGYELDTHYSKIGDGVLTWNALPYTSASYAANAAGGGGSGTVLVTASLYQITASSAVNATNSKTASYLNGKGVVSSTLDFVPSAAPAFTEGRLYYDSTDKCLTVMSENSTSIQVGQEVVVRVHNNTGTTILNGQVVASAGSTTGQRPNVKLAIGDGLASETTFLGVVTEDIAQGADGFATVNGLVHDINTNSWNEGDTLWVSTTSSGSMTNVHPTYGHTAIQVGLVVYKHINNGIVLVRMSRHDVDFALTASNAVTASSVNEAATGTGLLVRQNSPSVYFGANGAIRPYGTSLEVFDFQADGQVLNTDGGNLNVISNLILPTVAANRVLTTNSSSVVEVSGITTTQLNDLPNKYSSGSAMTASGVSSAGPLKVMMPQPDSVVQWPAAKSESYGRFLFSQGNTEFGTLQVLGSGFDQFYSTSGRSNAMEFYNNYGPIVFFNRGSERMRVAASGSIIVNRPGITSSLNTLEVNGTISCSVITASLFNGTASYASQALSASWAPSVGGPGGGTTLFTGSLYQITASKAVNSTSASYADKAGIAVNLNSTFEAFNDGTNFYIQNYGEVSNESRINYDNVAVQYNFYVPVNIPTVNGNIAGTKANMSQVTSSAIKTGRWTHYEDGSNNLIFKYT